MAEKVVIVLDGGHFRVAVLHAAGDFYLLTDERYVTYAEAREARGAVVRDLRRVSKAGTLIGWRIRR